MLSVELLTAVKAIAVRTRHYFHQLMSNEQQNILANINLKETGKAHKNQIFQLNKTLKLETSL
jgi:hypothetical protein